MKAAGITGAALVLGLALAPMAVAQEGEGGIIGRVVADDDGAPVEAAQVLVPGTGIGTLTDGSGRFLLPTVPAGTHGLTIRALGFAPETVRAVRVQPGENVRVEVSLASEAVALEGFSIRAAIDRGSTAALTRDRRRAAGVTDAVGSEEIARSSDGNAAEALARVPGVTVVGGKYVHIRGLGERYAATTLNGMPMPSPEPDRKAVPLDLVPTSLLERITTAKTYTPDRPGDYSGGLVDIRTRDFPSRGLFEVGLSGGHNSATSFRTGLGYPGGRLDALGFDDGTRALPAAVPDDRRVRAGRALSAEEVEAVGESFLGAWAPSETRLAPNQGLSLVLGDRLSVGDHRPLGFLATLTHSSAYSQRRDWVERVFSSAGADDPEVDYRGQSTRHSASLGGLFTATFEPAPEHRITLETVYTRSVDDESRVLEGYNLDSDADQRNTRIRYLAQSVLSTQLHGRYAPGGADGLELAWRGGYNRAGRYEPNTREVLYRRAPDGRFLFENFIQSGSVFHQDLIDNGWTGGIDGTVPLGGRSAALEVGGSASARERGVYTRRFRLVNAGALHDSVRALPPNDLFSEATIGPDGFQMQETTFRPDNYDAVQRIYAGYALLDAELMRGDLRITAGGRVEHAIQRVDPRDLFAIGLEPLGAARLENTDVLPALNLTYSPAPDANVRFAISQTLARPQFRELAPFSFADYAGGFLTMGNPALRRTRIRNYDLRWEWFPAARSVVAASAFYKRFHDPIEVFVFPSSELMKSWVNAEQAVTYGLELEARASIGSLAAALENLDVNLNLTLVRSEVETGDAVRIFLPGTGDVDLAGSGGTRALQGQSPYVLNAGLSYVVPGVGTTATALYRRFGSRIDAVGGLVLEDIYEEARERLDLVIEQPLPGGFDLKLTADRLIGQRVEFTQGGGVVRSYDPGRTISLSLGWSPGE